MTGKKLNFYWRYTIQYIAPVMVLASFIGGLINLGLNPPMYEAWHKETAEKVKTSYPWWGLVLVSVVIIVAITPIPYAVGKVLIRKFYNGNQQQQDSDSEVKNNPFLLNDPGAVSKV